MQNGNLLATPIGLWVVLTQTISTAEIKAVSNGSKIDVSTGNPFFTSYDMNPGNTHAKNVMKNKISNSSIK